MYVEASIFKYTISAISKAEITGTFINTKLAVPLCMCLIEIGYLQLATYLKIDNTTTYSILTKLLLLKRSKAIDMRFYLLRDRENQK